MASTVSSIISDLANTKSWVLSTISSPSEFQALYQALQKGYESKAVSAWLNACEALSHVSCKKAFYYRKNRHLDRDDLIQHGQMASAVMASQIASGDIVIRTEPIRYAWRAIKREMHSAAFGKMRQCECRAGGICQFQCDCADVFGINCDCSCACKCHKRTVSNFTNHFGDGDYDPIDRLAGEGVAFRERVEDIHHRCHTPMERDVLNGIVEAIENGKAPNSVYVTLNYTEKEIMESWRTIASHYLKVLVERGEALPGRRGGNQRRPPRKPIPRLAA